MKKSLLLFFCFCWSALVFAQHELHQQYLVYLHDGSFLKGELMGEDEEAIQLKLINGETITLPLTLVDKIKINKKKQSFLSKGITIQDSGPYNIVSFGLLVGQQTGFSASPTIGVSFSYIRGHQLNKHLALGGGISLDTYDNSFLPVYVDCRGYFLHKKTSLYYSVNAGYALAFDQFKRNKEGQYYKGGVLVHPSLGVRLAGKQNYSFLLDLGYRFQYAKRESTWSEFTDKIIYRRLTLRMGFLF